MKRLGLEWLICSAVAVGMLLSGGDIACARSHRGTVSPVQISILVPQTEYRIGEPLDGTVVLTNRSPSNFPAVFEIRLYHDGELASALSTSLRGVPQGTTRFAFKNFGIPLLPTGPDAEGSWRILIYQRGLDPAQGAEVTIDLKKQDEVKQSRKKKSIRQKRSKSP